LPKVCVVNIWKFQHWSNLLISSEFALSLMKLNYVRPR
jgi:hypothetical protein